MEELLLYFSLKYDGNFDKIFDALKSKETIDEKLRSQFVGTTLLYIKAAVLNLQLLCLIIILLS